MRLVIDFRMHNASGIGTYIKNIIEFLVPLYDITLLGNEEEIRNYEFYNNIEVVNFTTNIYTIKEQVMMPFIIPACDIFWSPHFNVPIFPIRAKKRLTTIHDMFHIAYYNQMSLIKRLYTKIIMNRAIDLSDSILTVSDFSKKGILNFKKTKKDISVQYNAIDFSKFKVIKDCEKLSNVKQKYNLPDDFVLFVGNVKPHKNIKSILLAINDLDVNLVVVGKKEGFITGDNEVDTIIKNNKNLNKRIFFTGYVDDLDLPCIYNLANIFAFPSLYEGFGIPPLEAQACGTPVICSNAASLPEVCGDDSVLYINPLDISSIKKSIVKLMSDEKLQDDLIQKGFENIKRFSWEETAKNITKVIKGIL